MCQNLDLEDGSKIILDLYWLSVWISSIKMSSSSIIFDIQLHYNAIMIVERLE